jgi:hypothetical protein
MDREVVLHLKFQLEGGKLLSQLFLRQKSWHGLGEAATASSTQRIAWPRVGKTKETEPQISTFFAIAAQASNFV